MLEPTFQWFTWLLCAISILTEWCQQLPGGSRTCSCYIHHWWNTMSQGFGMEDNSLREPSFLVELRKKYHSSSFYLSGVGFSFWLSYVLCFGSASCNNIYTLQTVLHVGWAGWWCFSHFRMVDNTGGKWIFLGIDIRVILACLFHTYFLFSPK